MSLPDFSAQSELFSTAGLSASLFPQTDRYRLFGQVVYPRLTARRAALEQCYCAENGRTAIEPVLMLGVSILQELDGIPDRQAVEMLHYHAGWNFALNRQLGDPVFHPTSLVNFRNRLAEHEQSALGFTMILDALQEAGLVSRQSRQRLDSTQMFGRVARMSRLDCVRESLRLALQALAPLVGAESRPLFWVRLWERYVESQTDYRAGSETLARKLAEAGTDAWQWLQWLRQEAHAKWLAQPQAQLLARVFAEQFEVRAGEPAPLGQEKTAVVASRTPADAGLAEGPQVPATTVPSEPKPEQSRLAAHQAAPPAAAAEPAVTVAAPVVPGTPPAPAAAQVATAETRPPGQNQTPEPTVAPGTVIQPKDKKELVSERVQNPHEPEATYAAKGQGEKKKEHVGYKVQVAETVCEVSLAPGEPTRNFITGMVTHPAYESDEAGAVKMEQEQAQMGLDKPPVQYVDGAYVSAQKLAQAQAEGRELMGPAQSSPRKVGQFTAEDFHVRVEDRQATCPAGKTSTQCSRLEEAATAKVSYRFEWSTQCHDCPLRASCLGKDQRHRTLVVGEHHTVLQARRTEQQTHAFKQRMKHRNAIEGTQSELVRAHGLRQARYRGLGKTKLQNYFIGAACNVKRWLRREAWKLQQAASVLAAPAQTVSGH